MMTEQQFDAQLQHIEDEVATKQTKVDGYRDQHMAKLFVESEWSQEDLAEHLAKRWGKEVSRQWVGYHLLFGRFLLFFATSRGKDEWQMDRRLTEWTFRNRYWEGTKADGDFRGHKANTEGAVADEKRRFGEIIEELKHSGLRRKGQPIRKGIIEALRGKTDWFTVEEIRDRVAKKMDGIVTATDIIDCLRKNLKPREDEPYRVEKAGDGAAAKYRLVRVKGKVVDRKQIARWSHDMVPMLEELIREAQKERVEISLSRLCELAGKIKRVMENVTAQVPANE